MVPKVDIYIYIYIFLMNKEKYINKKRHFKEAPQRIQEIHRFE